MMRLMTILAFIVLFTAKALAGELPTIKEEVRDSIISTKITASFTANRQLNPLKIHVHTQKGVVYLQGFVKDKDAYVNALRIAKNTRGVKHINTDKLHIKKVNTGLTDALITARVETAVLEAKVLDDESIPLVGINAHTVNGVVTLKGVVPSKKARDAIIKRAKNVSQVKEVVNHLHIGRSHT